jgi:hypothetical protein
MPLYRIEKGTIQESEYSMHADFAFEAFGCLFFTSRETATRLSLGGEVVEVHSV